MIFDYETAAKRVGIGPDDLGRLVAATRREFPGDEMMMELHVLRAIQAIERGDATLPDVLAPRAAA